MAPRWLLALVVALFAGLPAFGQDLGPTDDPPVEEPAGSADADGELPGVEDLDADEADVDAPTARFSMELGGEPQQEDLAATIKIALILTVLSLAPAILVTATSFTRILIVLSFVRLGLQTPSLPPNQVLVGLALFLTLLSMGPVIDRVHEDAIAPYLDEEIDTKTALERASGPLRGFLLAHTRERTLGAYLAMARLDAVSDPADIPLRVLLPAFVTSELTTAFEMGVVILIPFLVIDLVAASVLLSMNMIMLPPATVTVPVKVLVFVLVDGWQLVIHGLVAGVGA